MQDLHGNYMHLKLILLLVFFLSFITSVLYLNYVKIEVMSEDEAAMVATDVGGWGVEGLISAMSK